MPSPSNAKLSIPFSHHVYISFYSLSKRAISCDAVFLVLESAEGQFHIDEDSKVSTRPAYMKLDH